MDREAARVARKPAGLRQNLLWAVCGQGLYSLAQWLTLIVLARFGSTVEVGRYAFALALTAPVVLFFGLVLSEVQATDAREEYNFRDYLGLRILTACLALATIGLLGAAGEIGRGRYAVILLVGIAKSVDSISEICFSLMQKYERMDLVARGLVANGVISVSALALAAALTGSAVGAAVGSCFGSLAALLGVNVPNARRLYRTRETGDPDKRAAFGPRWHPPTLRRMAWACLPLGVMTLMNSLNANIPRYFVDYYLSDHALGLYAAAASVPMALVMLISAIGQAASPRLSRYFSLGERSGFWRLILRLAVLSLAAGLCFVAAAAAAGERVLRLLFGIEYAGEASVLTVLALAGCLSILAGLLNFGLLAARKFRELAAIYLLVVGVTSVACLGAVPDHRLLGAALATLIGAGVQALACLVLVVRAARARFQEEQPSQAVL